MGATPRCGHCPRLKVALFMGAEAERRFIGRSLLSTPGDSTERGYEVGPRHNETKGLTSPHRVGDVGSVPTPDPNLRPDGVRFTLRSFGYKEILTR